MIDNAKNLYRQAFHLADHHGANTAPGLCVGPLSFRTEKL